MHKYKLKDVCKIEKGKIGITKAIAGEYPLVVTAEGRASHNEWHFNKAATIVPLVSSTGHGHASIKRLHYAEGKYAVGNILATLIPKDHNFLNAKYLYVYLTINKDQLLVSQMTGAANVSLTLTRLKEVEVEIPDYDTQQRIVSQYEKSKGFKDKMLSQIELRKEKIEKLRQQILQDAITGKLSKKWRKENPDVESAEKLLKRMNEEKLKGTKSRMKNVKAIKGAFNIPETWEWVRFEEYLDIQGGSQPPKTKFVDINRENYIRLFQIRDFGESPVPIYVPENSVTKFFKPGDILLARYGGSLGKVFISDTSGAYNVALIKLIFSEILFNSKYLYILFLSRFYQDFVSKVSRSAQAGFNKKDIGKIKFTLPPVAEQKYIVSRIESLFTKLDQIRGLNLENEGVLDLLNQVLLKEMSDK